jgi:hypothetical protein
MGRHGDRPSLTKMGIGYLVKASPEMAARVEAEAPHRRLARLNREHAPILDRLACERTGRPDPPLETAGARRRGRTPNSTRHS